MKPARSHRQQVGEFVAVIWTMLFASPATAPPARTASHTQHGVQLAPWPVKHCTQSPGTWRQRMARSSCGRHVGMISSHRASSIPSTHPSSVACQSSLSKRRLTATRSTHLVVSDLSASAIQTCESLPVQPGIVGSPVLQPGCSQRSAASSPEGHYLPTWWTSMRTAS